MKRDAFFQKHRDIKSKADAGDVMAQYDFGWYCEWECMQEAPHDPALGLAAAHYYQLAAEQGNMDAALDLGCIYMEGIPGVPSDFDRAIHWYQYAGDREYPKAFRCLAYALGFHGFHDNFQDYAVAYAYFAKGAELGEPNCLLELGHYYAKGRIVEQDWARAVALYQQSYDVIAGEIRDDTYADACLSLGECYLKGLGTAQDPALAKRYLKEAQTGYQHRLDSNRLHDVFDNISINLDKVNDLLQQL